MSFQKGRLKTGGRKLGSPNKSTQEVGQFFREVLEREELQCKWRQYFTKTPLERMEPKLLTLAFHYAYGRPRERIELSEADSDSLFPKVLIYLPEKIGRLRDE